MAFSDYNHIAQVQKEYGILSERATFLHTHPVQPAAEFLQEIEFNRKTTNVFASEAACKPGDHVDLARSL